LPSYAELQAWEASCRWLDTQPRQRARLPVLGLAAFTTRQDAEALPALGKTPEERELPAGLLRGMRTARLVRHTSVCEWVLAKAWRERLLGFWQGYDCVKRELPAVVATASAQARSLVAGIATWVLNWRVDEALPPRLRRELDDYQTQAREEETECDTRWVYDGVPLRMYRWGTKPEHGRGVSWSYVLLMPALRLLICKTPLGGIVAQARQRGVPVATHPARSPARGASGRALKRLTAVFDQAVSVYGAAQATCDETTLAQERCL
jgi:hypothetical protein